MLWSALMRTASPPFLNTNIFIISILCLPHGGMVPHMVPISLRQIKNRIPPDPARLQATNEPCPVGSENCWVLQCRARYGLAWPRSLRAFCVPTHRGGARVRRDHG